MKKSSSLELNLYHKVAIFFKTLFFCEKMVMLFLLCNDTLLSFFYTKIRSRGFPVLPSLDIPIAFNYYFEIITRFRYKEKHKNSFICSNNNMLGPSGLTDGHFSHKLAKNEYETTYNGIEPGRCLECGMHYI